MSRHFLVALILVFAVIRLASITLPDAILSPDSVQFLNIAELSVFDPAFYMSLRPITVPLFYKLVGGHKQLIVLMQEVMSIVSWLLLAGSVATLFQSFTSRSLAVCVVLLLGLNPAVTSLNRMVLSESISTSLLVMLLASACLLYFSHRSRHRSRPMLWAAALSIALLWCFAHDLNAYFFAVASIGIALVLFCKQLYRQQFSRTFWAVPAVSLAAFVVSATLMNISQRWHFPLSNVIAQRILPYPERLEFFVSNGMPASPELLAYSGKWASSDRGMLSLGEYREWLIEEGKQTYAMFLATHPRYAFASLWNNLPAVVNADLSYLYGSTHKTTYAAKLMDAYNISSNAFVVLAIIGCVLCAAVIIYPATPMARSVGFGLLIVAVANAAQIVIAYHGDEMEISRHCFLPVLSLKLMSCLSALLAADQLLSLIGKRREQFPTSVRCLFIS